ncbi:hypothetical protein TBLA_0D04140 [Henningerozyma blattae CBS 6284]|uniref:CBM21 domain-containing protein n=1 Tax=Henningerozyma blattae (strain ATCC 34711 / CBS 6284 / DSM 70876 / NBRC 10599 / NRRL Y-10934 / UCD 77-7) TaxID=1071380 RepID=I2H3F9_HENB6|nr:hypothetical protein TBLA_0D04140 [Tetrapisispora blattae CBS 6284]CCH60911.1 hypothetical protein TBLA_0D04140 [Tetrapisispora blattae CBS 6284]
MYVRNSTNTSAQRVPGLSLQFLHRPRRGTLDDGLFPDDELQRNTAYNKSCASRQISAWDSHDSHTTRQDIQDLDPLDTSLQPLDTSTARFTPGHARSRSLPGSPAIATTSTAHPPVRRTRSVHFDTSIPICLFDCDSSPHSAPPGQQVGRLGEPLSMGSPPISRQQQRVVEQPMANPDALVQVQAETDTTATLPPPPPPPLPLPPPPPPPLPLPPPTPLLVALNFATVPGPDPRATRQRVLYAAAPEGPNIRLASLTLHNYSYRDAYYIVLGKLHVRNLAYHKQVSCVFTWDSWTTQLQITASYVGKTPSEPPSESVLYKAPGQEESCENDWDIFQFVLDVGDMALDTCPRLELCAHATQGVAPQGPWSHDDWANNGGANYIVAIRPSLAGRT